MGWTASAPIGLESRIRKYSSVRRYGNVRLERIVELESIVELEGVASEHVRFFIGMVVHIPKAAENPPYVTSHWLHA